MSYHCVDRRTLIRAGASFGCIAFSGLGIGSIGVSAAGGTLPLTGALVGWLVIQRMVPGNLISSRSIRSQLLLVRWRQNDLGPHHPLVSRGGKPTLRPSRSSRRLGKLLQPSARANGGGSSTFKADGQYRSRSGRILHSIRRVPACILQT